MTKCCKCHKKLGKGFYVDLDENRWCKNCYETTFSEEERLAAYAGMTLEEFQSMLDELNYVNQGAYWTQT